MKQRELGLQTWAVDEEKRGWSAADTTAPSYGYSLSARLGSEDFYQWCNREDVELGCGSGLALYGVPYYCSSSLL